MNELRRKPGFGKGVLRRAKGLQRFGGARYEPPPSLAGFVEHFWTTHWDLRGEPPYDQEVLPHPSVHLVLEPGRSEVVGVMTGKFTRRLEGLGRVFAAKFLPGGFAAFFDQPVASLTDTRVPVATLLSVDVAALEAEVFAPTADDSMRVDALARALRSCGPRADPQAARVAEIVETIVQTPEIVRVDDVATRTGLSVRTLQRLFSRYVGVSPKWVIRRKRLHEAAERLADADPGALAELAAELGYADQAHFVRDFRALVGTTPGGYRREL